MPISQDQYVKDLVQRMANGGAGGPQYGGKLSDDTGIVMTGETGTPFVRNNSAYAGQTRRYANESDADYDARMDRFYGDDIKARTGYNSADNRAFTEALLSGNPDKLNKFFNKDYVNPGDALDNQYKDFINRMNSQLDTRDPEVRNAMNMATNVAQRQSRNSGLRGGLSTSGIAQAAVNGLNPLRQHRQNLALQALNALSGRGFQKQQVGMQEDAAARQGQNERWAKEQALMQMILSGVGTAASVIAAPFTGGATIPGAVAGGAALANGVSNYANASRPASRGTYGSSSGTGSGNSSGGWATSG